MFSILPNENWFFFSKTVTHLSRDQIQSVDFVIDVTLLIILVRYRRNIKNRARNGRQNLVGHKNCHLYAQTSENFRRPRTTIFVLIFYCFIKNIKIKSISLYFIIVFRSTTFCDLHQFAKHITKSNSSLFTVSVYIFYSIFTFNFTFLYYTCLFYAF